MREFVPLDIHKSSVAKMVAEGLTPEVAQRVWNVKALSLICTHPEDIRKVRTATCAPHPAVSGSSTCTWLRVFYL
jgi:hypothetical protein